MFCIPKVLSVCNGYFTERRTIQQRNENSDYEEPMSRSMKLN